MALLDIKGLKKTYISKCSKEEIQALKDINFSVDKGVYCYYGRERKRKNYPLKPVSHV